MGIIGTIILFFLFALIFNRYKDNLKLTSWAVVLGWTISVFAGFVYLFVFKNYFGNGTIYGDSKNFLQDGLILGNLAQEDPLQFLKLLIGLDSNNMELLNNELAETNIWSYGDNGDFINDNRLIIKINAIISLFSAGNVWIHALIFSAFSYTGVLLLFQSFKAYCSREKILFYGLLLFPTISFWGNGITKECVMVFSMGLFFYSFLRMLNIGLNWKMILVAIIAVMLLTFNKPHVGIILLFFSWILLFIRSKRFGWKEIGLSAIITIFIATIFSYTPHRINLVDRTSFKQKDLINLGEGGVFFINDSAFCAFDYEERHNFTYYEPSNRLTIDRATKGKYKLFGDTTFHPFNAPASNQHYDVYHIIPPSSSIIEVNRINYSGVQLIKNIPQALTNVLIRPYPWDPGDPLKILPFIENILFFLFMIYALLNRKTTLIKSDRVILTYLLFSALALLLIIGWTTPILGAIVRYKIAPTLLLFIALTCLIKPSKPKHENS